MVVALSLDFWRATFIDVGPFMSGTGVPGRLCASSADCMSFAMSPAFRPFAMVCMYREGLKALQKVRQFDGSKFETLSSIFHH